MTFDEFVTLAPRQMAELLTGRSTEHSSALGVAMPLNGTRRWYLAHFKKQPDELLTEDYSLQTRRGMWDLAVMLFADGVKALYMPVMGRALAERGPEYMHYAAQSLAWLATDEALDWYRQQGITAMCYGDIDILPTEVYERLAALPKLTAGGANHLRYGVFADRSTPDLIRRTIRLHKDLGKLPTESQLLEDYYAGPFVPAGLWIGTDQPTLFDVPLAVHGNTALYFLQFPTLFLDRARWRRILYDYLFVRGDQETLYPENLGRAGRVLGLGVRRDGYWQASET